MSVAAAPVGHAALAPSAWVQRWAGLIPAGARVLDVACGHGRHLRWLAQQGYHLTGVDANAQALAHSTGHGELVCADLENQPWPLLESGQPRQFEGVVVTNYLWRPLLPVLAQSLALGGVLIYETFAHGNEAVGRPSRPDFLLQPDELLRAFPTLHVVAYEDGYLEPPARFVQRIVAMRPGAQPLAPRLAPRLGVSVGFPE